MKLQPAFDSMEFMKFMWFYDRLKEQKEKEHTDSGGTSSVNLLDNIEQLKRFSGS